MTGKGHLSIQEVEKTLASIKEEETKKVFLQKLYAPGNKEIAKLLMPYDTSVIEKELLFGLQINDKERAIEMGKKEIDFYFEHGLHISLVDKIKGWNNEEIKNYALSKAQNSTTKNELSNNLYILKEFGTKEETKKAQESLLELEFENHDYPLSAANLLNNLGRYDESISRNIKHFDKENYYILKDARNTAKNNVPNRQKEIAKMVLKHGIEDGREILFYECGIYLERNKEVKSTIKNSIDKILKEEINDDPRFFDEIVCVMKNLGGFEKETETLFEKMEEYANNKHIFAVDTYKELADLYNKIGNRDKALAWLEKALDYEIAQCNPSHSENTIKYIEETYGEGLFDEKKMHMLEKNGNFLGAAEVAEKLGQKEKTEAYRNIDASFKIIRTSDLLTY